MTSRKLSTKWHNGLKYKLMNLNLPSTTTRILRNFIESREAKIKVGKFTGPAFALESGVPQGSSLSATLYLIYTSDLPKPAVDCYNIIYADDITQTVTCRGKSRRYGQANGK